MEELREMEEEEDIAEAEREEENRRIDEELAKDLEPGEIVDAEK
jgi:hypothetical protein